MWPFPTAVKYQIEANLPIVIVESKLRNVLLPTVWQAINRECYVGRIEDSKIRIAHYRPFTRRALSPRFSGTLLGIDGKTIIKGRFEMTPFERISCILFLVGTLLNVFREIIFSIQGGWSIRHAVLAGCFLALFAMCLIVIRVGWVIRQDDVRAIQRLFRETLIANE